MTQPPAPEPPKDPGPASKPEPAPYELEPEAATPRPPEPRPRLDAKPFMDDVDDDADMTHDPEVERALGRTPRTAPATAPQDADAGSPPSDPLVKPGRGEPRTLAIAGGVLTLAAVVVACVYAESRWYAAGLAAAYLTLLHVGTGVLAVGLTAHFQGVPIGRLDLAAARMFVAVALFMLILHLQIPGPAWAVRALLTVGACLAYAATVWALFRLSKERLRVLLASHAGLAVLLWAVVALHVWASDTGATAAGTPPAAN